MDGAAAARESLLLKGLSQARGKADWGEAERRGEGVPGRGDVGSKSVQVGLLEHMPGQGRLTRLGGSSREATDWFPISQGLLCEHRLQNSLGAFILGGCLPHEAHGL